MEQVPIVQKLVEEQCRRAELQANRPANKILRAERWPLLTISREPGAGGTTLGKTIAKRLGFICWDRELLSRVASECHAIESVLADVDEHVRSSLTDFLRSLVVGIEYSQEEYGRTLAKVVGSIARQGAAVIVGRGAHALLERERSLSIRVICPEPERMRRVAERDGLSLAASLQQIREQAARSAAFMKYHFKQDSSGPQYFDLTLNSEKLSISSATDIVEFAYRSKFGRLRRLAPLPRVAEAGSQGTTTRVV